MTIWLVAFALLVTAVCFVLGVVVREHAGTEPVWSALETDKSLAAPISHPRQAHDNEAIATAVKEIEDEGVTHNDGKTDCGKDPWLDHDYCWVVVCKNRRFHRHPNPFRIHRIPLGQTDTLEPRPRINSPFDVRCDECGKTHTYQPSEVLRYEMDVPPSFVPHPLFREQSV